MYKTIVLLFITMTLLVTAGCSQASNEVLQMQESVKVGKQQMTDKKENVWHEVTVKYYDLEGGFYGLISTKGDKLLPMNLAKKYQLPGTILKVKGQVINGMATIQQWGEPFKITDVELIKLGKADKGIIY